MPSSLINVTTRWVNEIKKHCPNTPFLLVGTKIDLRNDPIEKEKLLIKREKMISYEEGVKVAKKIKAVKYVECKTILVLKF